MAGHYAGLEIPAMPVAIPAGSHIIFRHSRVVHLRLWTAKRPAPLAGSDAKPGFETLPE